MTKKILSILFILSSLLQAENYLSVKPTKNYLGLGIANSNIQGADRVTYSYHSQGFTQNKKEKKPQLNYWGMDILISQDRLSSDSTYIIVPKWGLAFPLLYDFASIDFEVGYTFGTGGLNMGALYGFTTGIGFSLFYDHTFKINYLYTYSPSIHTDTGIISIYNSMIFISFNTGWKIVY